MANKISVIIDVATAQAQSAIKGFKKEVSEADGVIGKFKVAGSQSMGLVKQYAGELAISGGAALVAFGAHAVQSFTEGALAAGKFADASGLSAEEASRWTEVADDVGVSQESLSAAFLKMEKTLATGKGAWTEYGIEVKRGKDGQVDATATMLGAIQAINKIPDATKRAEVASSLFGKGWAELSEVILSDAGDIEDALAGVSDAQIFDDAEVEKARKLREAWDKLSDRLNAFVLTVGGRLVPVLVEVADTVEDVIGPVEKFGEVVGDTIGRIDAALDKLGPFGEGIKKVGTYIIPVYGQMKLLADGADLVKDAFGLNAEVNGKLTTSLSTLVEAQEAEQEAIDGTKVAIANARMEQNDYVGGLEEQARATDKAKEATEQSNWFLRKQADDAEKASRKIDDLRDSHRELRNELADRSAYLDLQDAFDGVEQAAVEAYTAAAEGADDAEQKLRDAERAQIDLKQRVLDYTDAIGGIPEETTSRIIAFIDEGNLAAAEEALKNLTRQRYADVLVRLSGGKVTNDGGIDFGGGVIGRDSGGPIPGPRGAPVPMIGHGGEFMLSADVVDAIKQGRQTRGLGSRQGATTPPTSPGLDLAALAQLIEAAVERGAANGTARGMGDQAAKLAAGVRG